MVAAIQLVQLTLFCDLRNHPLRLQSFAKITEENNFHN